LIHNKQQTGEEEQPDRKISNNKRRKNGGSTRANEVRERYEGGVIRFFQSRTYLTMRIPEKEA
jgi:hypothetical protein